LVAVNSFSVYKFTQKYQVIGITIYQNESKNKNSHHITAHISRNLYKRLFIFLYHTVA